MNNPEKRIYFLTGASGAGKTTLVSQLEKKFSQKDDWVFLYFDSVGVPLREEMTKKHGSPSGWQKDMILEWIEKILSGYPDKKVVILEGQVNIEFIKDGFAQHDFTNYRTILVDCSEEEMVGRLTRQREQPELANEDMKNWLSFLRSQAQQYGSTVIDTSTRTIDGAIVRFEQILIEDGIRF